MHNVCNGHIHVAAIHIILDLFFLISGNESASDYQWVNLGSSRGLGSGGQDPNTP